MGIKSIFGDLFRNSGGPPGDGFSWSDLDTPESLDLVLSDHSPRLHVVFKHSTSCGLSGMMLRRFVSVWKDAPAEFHLLDIRQHRELSDRLARELSCRHESPQVLLIRRGNLQGHASHGDIPGLKPADYE